jgi:uncharacterized protein (DUF362 family)
MQGDRPLLVVVEGTDLRTMLEAGLDALGGMNRLVEGRKVVLKPNVVASQPPPVTTDIELVMAVAEQAREAGANSILACDANSSGSNSTRWTSATGPPMSSSAMRTGVRIRP